MHRSPPSPTRMSGTDIALKVLTWGRSTGVGFVMPIVLFRAALLGIFLALGASVANASVLISIDKMNQQMTVTVDGKQRYVWPVSTGRFGYGTPSGTYRPFRMEVDHFSREWDD